MLKSRTIPLLWRGGGHADASPARGACGTPLAAAAALVALRFWRHMPGLPTSPVTLRDGQPARGGGDFGLACQFLQSALAAAAHPVVGPLRFGPGGHLLLHFGPVCHFRIRLPAPLHIPGQPNELFCRRADASLHTWVGSKSSCIIAGHALSTNRG